MKTTIAGIAALFLVSGCSDSDTESHPDTGMEEFDESSILGTRSTGCFDESFDDVSLSSRNVVTLVGTETAGTFETDLDTFLSADCSGDVDPEESVMMSGEYLTGETFIGAEGLMVTAITLTTTLLAFDDGLQIVPAPEDAVSQTVFHIDMDNTLFLGFAAEDSEEEGAEPDLTTVNLDFESPFFR